MKRIQHMALSLLLLPGLAACNGSNSSQPAPVTEDSKFVAVPGPAGEKGPSGEKGAAGPDGKAGLNGKAGSDGKDGLDGKAGPVDLGAETIADGTITKKPGGFDVQLKKDVLQVRTVAANALRVHFLPNGGTTEESRVIDPNLQVDQSQESRVNGDGKSAEMSLGAFTANWDTDAGVLAITDTADKTLMSLNSEDLKNGSVAVWHDASDTLYGIGGGGRSDDGANLFRNWQENLKTGDQGHAGAPFVWSTAGYGVLVDTMGGRDRTIELRDSSLITFANTSKTDVAAYLVVGRPAELFGAVAKISGRTPLFPKWAMGFTNSQWGADNQWSGTDNTVGLNEVKLKEIISRYRREKVPIDAFTFDLDWMNWGRQDIPYSQFGWNKDKFPNGANGGLKTWLDQQGVKMAAILKPRVAVNSAEGAFLGKNFYWMPNTPVTQDFFTTTMMRHVNFGNPTVRSWYFDRLKPAFDTGIAGWWNDEADSSGATDDGNETEGLDMQRGVYEGQRAYSNQRVWSINRNFYLGSQRYAYGLWSGDIDNGFASMAVQRQKMLTAINAGAMQWTMDTGGFANRIEAGRAIGTQYEDYARWVQFAAFTPIFRVHGENGVQRQPWWYAPPDQPTAVAAVGAIRLRYRLIPYIYSYEHQRNKTGVGIVRPLLFDWPNDKNVRNDYNSWLFGEWLLVSPVVVQGQRNKDIYLPAGGWTEWRSGAARQGGQIVNYDTATWEDNIPLFFRAGAIVPMMREDVQYVGEKPLKELDVEVFPDTRRTSFDYYDDDGKTYDYEKNVYFLQTLSVQRTGNSVQFETAAPDAAGSFKPELEYYTVKIHGPVSTSVKVNGTAMTQTANVSTLTGTSEGWATGLDPLHGNIPVTYVRIKAQLKQSVTLTAQ